MLARLLRGRSLRQHFSSSTATSQCSFDELEEIRQQKRIQSTEFYDKFASKRCYFYYIDLQGRLFLEDATPKNIATCLKSEKFINFFYSRLELNSNQDPFISSFPYVSPCGKEHNFIKSAAIETPWVFQELTTNNTLLMQGGLSTAWDPSSLKFGSETGRLYHAITNPKLQKRGFNIGLVKSHLAIQISQNIHINDSSFVYQDEDKYGPSYPVGIHNEVALKTEFKTV